MAIDQIAQLGLSSLQVIYYLAKLFRLQSGKTDKISLEDMTDGNKGLDNYNFCFNYCSRLVCHRLSQQN
ncbi:hypothetical protein DMB41_20790 [Pectobacterium carotovorum subsp. carotovorum]|nr:hypothetical protein DMB41_20790 [Pectobacterium carotovorum subsp. carotovorum]